MLDTRCVLGRVWTILVNSLLTLPPKRSVPVSYTHLDVYKRQGVVPDSEAVSTTDFSVMRLWPMTFHSAAWIR